MERVFNKISCLMRKWRSRAPRKVSETSKVRDSLSIFCEGNGLDIGFGGDPIVPHAICLDLAEPYAQYCDYPQHLKGDGTDLFWFRDDSLDFVYSSHVLEDFEDTSAVLNEWFRVIKIGGKLVLFLPDEIAYRAYCLQQGKPPNEHHKHENFGLKSLKDLVDIRPDIEIIHEKCPSCIYSFELVLRKIS